MKFKSVILFCFMLLFFIVPSAQAFEDIPDTPEKLLAGMYKPSMGNAEFKQRLEGVNGAKQLCIMALDAAFGKVNWTASGSPAQAQPNISEVRRNLALTVECAELFRSSYTLYLDLYAKPYNMNKP